MSDDRKAVKKIKRKNPHLRLVKNDDGKSAKGGSGRQDQLRFDRTKRTLIIAGSLLFVLLFLLIGYLYIITNYTVTTVHVEGNIHYTDEEIMEMVMSGAYGDNSLLLALKYRDKGIDDVPFIQTMDVTIEAGTPSASVYTRRRWPVISPIWASICILTKTVSWWKPPRRRRRGFRR